MHIGVDESGKGDYFGPLVVAACYVNKDTEIKLKSIGVKDSKLLSDKQCITISKQIEKICKYEIIKIFPERYNQLHEKLKNLNKMLAWAHGRAIKNLLGDIKEPIDYIICDKFGDEKLLEEAIPEIFKKYKVMQKVRAEDDVAVAAASILARAEFLTALRKISLEIGYKLPKGATHVEQAVKDIVNIHGPDVLNMVAKVHFKTTRFSKSEEQDPGKEKSKN